MDSIINKEIKLKVDNDIWRNRFHIQPPTGLLNDPNGLIYHNGIYHIFFQWHPNSPTHGLKYWNHVVSTDLVHFTQSETILKPDSVLDSHGAYSGSAIIINNEIQLYYTGNTRNENNERIPFQIIANLNNDIISNKRVAIDYIPDGYTDHFRDPKVFKKDNTYHMIIGAQTADLKGTALMFESLNGEQWSFKYRLKTKYDNLGFMWECPDLITLNNQDILLFCPQGSMNTPKEEHNIYPSAYLLGNFDIETGYLSNTDNPAYTDYGFDFYAPQTFLDEYGNTVLIAWIGMPEIEYPTDINMWAHVLSIPRILSIKNNKLYQIPHPNLTNLRKRESISFDNKEIYELIVDNITESISIDLYESTEKLILKYDKDSNTLTLDRGEMFNQFGVEYGTQRQINMDEPLNCLWLIRDTSTIEIFINNGRYTMTARFFPNDISGNININSIEYDNLKITLYDLEG